MKRELTGRHVFAIFAGGFAVIIGVNMVLATQAVRTFPGLEVKNSYVASQVFDEERRAQEALGWRIEPSVTDKEVAIAVIGPAGPVAPIVETATLGRATHVADDIEMEFRFDGQKLVAPRPEGLTRGNWNLRLAMTAADGTAFKQRVVIRVLE